MQSRALLALLALAALACGTPTRREDDDTTDPGPDAGVVDCSQPGAHGPPEVCNGKDDDCDGETDESDATDAKTWYRDLDGDGFGNPADTVRACSQPSGFVEKSGDCDDARVGVHPGATEIGCNGLDDDCTPDTLDFGDADHDGVSVCDGDCDDHDPTVFPGNSETCNGKDDDCSGLADDGLEAVAVFRDADGDGYGDGRVSQPTCGATPPGYVTNGLDCDDTKATIHPGAQEITCNNVDEDCDLATRDAPDEDFDGVSVCAGDCDDHNPNRFPGRPEECNGRDDDCDSKVDEDLPRAQYFPDNDRDGHGVISGAITACGAPDGYAALSDDCNDLRGDTYPGAPESCDGVDRNCDGSWSPIVPTVCATIQAAIDQARAGATITVQPGTYRENLDFKGKNLTVTSSGGPTQTTIDGHGAGPTVTFKTRETAAAVLSGFTIRGGSGTVYTAECQAGGCPRFGGGVLVDGASPTLQDLVITANTLVQSPGWSYGAGISLRSSNAVVKRTRIVSNSSDYYGGGAYVDGHSNPTFEQVRFDGNQGGIGGGLAIYYGAATVRNAIFGKNSGGSNGGIFCQGCTISLTNVTAHANTAQYEAGFLGVGYAGTATLLNVAMTNNTGPSAGAIWVNGATANVTFSLFNGNGVAGMTDPVSVPSANCRTGDPRYTGTSGNSPEFWDFHPLAGSPLVDAGTTSFNDANGSRSDIGAYGGPGSSW